MKIAIGKYASQLVPKEGLIGLGTGSTAREFITALAERFHKEHLEIACLPSSLETEALAKKLGLPLIDTASWDGSLHITFDGADLLHPDGSTIKGAGGALLREKIIAHASKKFCVMIDERKWKKTCNPPLPLCIIPFGAEATLKEIRNLGYKVALRKIQNKPFISDDGHWIVDIEVPLTVGSWKEINQQLKEIPGVVETGIFLKRASEAIIGFSNGEIIHHYFESST